MSVVLVTGATGFIGRQVLAPLRSMGFEVHGAARRPGNDVGVRWHAADLLDPASRAALVRAVGASHLVHLAWDVEPGRFWTAPENEAWRLASLDLAQRFAEAGGARAVFAGTCAEYDWTRRDERPWREDDPIRPATPYGAAKASLAEAASRIVPSLAWARLFHMFGPGEDRRRLVASLVAALREGRPAELSAGRAVRDFLDTRDLGAALARLLAASAVGGAVNVASGVGTSIAEVAATLGRLAGRPDLVRLGVLPDRPGEPPVIVADVTRLRREAGVAPPAALEARLREALSGAES